MKKRDVILAWVEREAKAAAWHRRNYSWCQEYAAIQKAEVAGVAIRVSMLANRWEDCDTQCSVTVSFNADTGGGQYSQYRVVKGGLSPSRDRRVCRELLASLVELLRDREPQED